MSRAADLMDLAEFLAALPPTAGVLDWEVTDDGRGWLRLTVTVGWPRDDAAGATVHVRPELSGVRQVIEP